MLLQHPWAQRGALHRARAAISCGIALGCASATHAQRPDECERIETWLEERGLGFEAAAFDWAAVWGAAGAPAICERGHGSESHDLWRLGEAWYDKSVADRRLRTEIGKAQARSELCEHPQHERGACSWFGVIDAGLGWDDMDALIDRIAAVAWSGANPGGARGPRLLRDGAAIDMIAATAVDEVVDRVFCSAPMLAAPAGTLHAQVEDVTYP